MTTEKVFFGSADATPRRCVTVRGLGSPAVPQVLGLRLDLANHSPTGFGWGYGGSGPAQLALAILAEVTGDDQLALGLYQQFKWDVISKLAMDADWRLAGRDVLAWLAAQVEAVS